MRQSFAPAFLVLALLALAPLAATAQVVKVEPLSHDFGEMKQQQTLTTTVTVTNDGGGLLQIEDVKADCGCTVPTLTKHSLAPGESTDVVIEFSSKRFRGKVTKGVKILTNDPLNPTVNVMITANVHTPLVVDPQSQRLGVSPHLRGEAQSRRATLTATGTEPLEISADKTLKGLFEVKVINNLDGNPQMAGLEVTAPATMKPGQYQDNVRVKTNIPDMHTLDFVIKTTIYDELLATPDRLTFRFKKEFSQSVRVSPFAKGTTFKVLSAECDLPEIGVEVIETVPGAETLIKVTGAPIANNDPRAIATKGRMSGTITVKTDLESTPVLEIPVTYMVRM